MLLHECHRKKKSPCTAVNNIGMAAITLQQSPQFLGRRMTNGFCDYKKLQKQQILADSAGIVQACGLHVYQS